MVETFLLSETTRHVGSASSLAAASGALPPGAYTTLRTYGGRSVVHLDDHVRRLEESAGGGARVDARALRASLARVLDETGHPESRIRLTFAPPRLYASVEPFYPLPDRLYREGARCVTLALQRDDPARKETRFIATAEAAYARLPEGIHEALMVGPDGAILEGLSSNFFAVQEGVLRTEGPRALPGLTRSLALAVAARLLPVRQTALRRDELPRAQEAFITSVSRGVLAVSEVDGVRVGALLPGPVTRAIAEGMDERIRAEAEVL